MSAEAVREAAPVEAEQDEPMRYHRVCTVCVPEADPGPPPMGTVAVCGERVLGIPAKYGGRACERCVRLWRMHVLGHFSGRGGA